MLSPQQAPSTAVDKRRFSANSPAGGRENNKQADDGAPNQASHEALGDKSPTVCVHPPDQLKPRQEEALSAAEEGRCDINMSGNECPGSSQPDLGFRVGVHPVELRCKNLKCTFQRLNHFS